MFTLKLKLGATQEKGRCMGIRFKATSSETVLADIRKSLKRDYVNIETTTDETGDFLILTATERQK